MAKSRSTKAIILASGQGLTTLVGLISAMVLARLFSTVDYATYRQTMLAYTFAAPFVMMGFNRALFYFLPTEKERPRGVLIENLLLLVTGGLLLTIFLLCGGSEWLAQRFNNPKLATTLLILAPYPLLILPASALGACLLARDRAGQVAVFNVASRVVMLVAVLAPCLIWPTPAVAIAGVVSGTLLTTAIALILMFRACPEGNWQPTMGGLRKQVSFSIPLGLASLAATISISLDKVLVAALCAPAAFAIYVNGAMEIPLIGIITGSVTSVLIVDYAKLYHEGRIEEIIGLIHRAMVKCALILIPVMVFLLCMAPEVMRLLYGARYEASAAPFRVYLLLLPMRTLTFGAILMATGNSRHILIQSVLGLTSKAVLAWYAIGLFGPIGAAGASVITGYFVSVSYLLVVLCFILKCPIRRLFPWRDLFVLSVASVIPGLIIGFLKNVIYLPDVVSLAITSMVYGLIVIVLFVCFKLVSAPKFYRKNND